MLTTAMRCSLSGLGVMRMLSPPPNRRALSLGNWGLAARRSPSWSRQLPTSARPRAAHALEDITRTTGHSAAHWAVGIEARSRALLSDGQDAELLYQRAINRLDRSRAVVALARAHLIYGEWLRRQHRRLDARAELRTAYQTFASIGAEAFAQRARRELLATGETVRKRNAQHRDNLTPQEAQIARLAAEGLSNPEIGSRLFISPRTVQYHLGKVFTKLEITSRNQLHRVLSADRAD